MFDSGQALHSGTTQWKYALLGGLASLPFTTLSYWQTGSELSLGAVVVGGILAGLLVTRAGVESTGVGMQVGIIGGLPVLWVLVDVLAATSGLAGPVWFVAGATLLTIGFALGLALLGFAIAGLLGEVGVRIGSRLAGNRREGSASVVSA